MGGQEDYGSQPHPKMNSEKRLLPVSSQSTRDTGTQSEYRDRAVSPTSPKHQWTEGSSWYQLVRKMKDEMSTEERKAAISSANR